MILTRAQRQRIDRIARGRSEEGLCLLEGPRAVRDALATGAVAEVWVSAAVAPDLRVEIEADARARGVPVGEGTARAFEHLGRTVTPQGVLALVRDPARLLDEVLGLSGALVWLDGVQDPGNVGAVVRAAAGLGAAGVRVGEGTADPLGVKALRASAGLALRIPFARAPAAEIARGAEAAGRPVWLLEHGGEDLRRLGDGAVPAGLVLVVGAEGTGPGEVARAVAVRRVGVPLAPGVDSLNAAVAAGVALSHLLRR